MSRRVFSTVWRTPQHVQGALRDHKTRLQFTVDEAFVRLALPLASRSGPSFTRFGASEQSRGGLL